jgi:hypothetical protein
MKDARGHGSNGRGSSADAIFKAMVANNPMDKATADAIFKAAVANNPMDKATADAVFKRMTDGLAAAKLAEGGAPGKNAPVPVHPAQTGERGRFGKIWLSRLGK